MSDQSKSRTYPDPKPWYRTKPGETLLSIVCIGVIGAAYGVITITDGILSEAAGFVGFVALLGVIYFSGRASQKAMGEVMGRE